MGERDVDDIWGYYPNDLTKYPFSLTKYPFSSTKFRYLTHLSFD